MASFVHDNAKWSGDLDRALARLRALPDGTDSWSAHRPSDDMIETVRAIFKKINKDVPFPIIAAGTNGTIQIKWQKPDVETSFFIYPDGTLEYLRKSKRAGRSSAGNLSLSQVNDLLADF